MTDTPPDVQALHRRLLLARSGEERMRMAASMGRTARALVWASLPEAIPEPDRREQFFLRLYGADFSPEQRAEIGAHVRSCRAPSDPESPQAALLSRPGRGAATREDNASGVPSIPAPTGRNDSDA